MADLATLLAGHESFSKESRYALLDAPHWEDSQLIAPDGTVIFDDRRQK